MEGCSVMCNQAVMWLLCYWTGRYRIQSESFPAIAGFLEELLTRLTCYHTKQVSHPFLPLPLLPTLPSPLPPSPPHPPLSSPPSPLLPLFLTSQEPQFQASYTSPLPLTEYFEIIEQHFKVGRPPSHTSSILPVYPLG